MAAIGMAGQAVYSVIRLAFPVPEKPEAPKPNSPREYWLNDDPERFVPSRRHNEGSFDPRFAYDLNDDDDQPMLPRAGRRVAAGPASGGGATCRWPHRAVFRRGATAAGRRIHVPARDRGAVFARRTHAQDPVPARLAPAVVRPKGDQPAAPVREMQARIEQRFHDSLAFEDDDEEDDDGDRLAPARSTPFAPSLYVRKRRAAILIRPEVTRRADALPNRAQRSRNGGPAIMPAQQEEGEFILPSMKLLSPAAPRSNNPELSDVALGRRAEMLQGVLDDFGVKGQITSVRPGPVVTMYELEPAPGTKSTRVIGLADDIARSMCAVRCRVAVSGARRHRDRAAERAPRDGGPARDPVARLRQRQGAAAAGAGQGHRRRSGGGRPGPDAAPADCGHHRLGQVGGDQHHDPVAALPLTPEECRFIMIDPKMLELSRL